MRIIPRSAGTALVDLYAQYMEPQIPALFTTLSVTHILIFFDFSHVWHTRFPRVSRPRTSRDDRVGSEESRSANQILGREISGILRVLFGLGIAEESGRPTVGSRSLWGPLRSCFQANHGSRTQTKPRFSTHSVLATDDA